MKKLKTKLKQLKEFLLKKMDEFERKENKKQNKEFVKKYVGDVFDKL